MGEAEYKKLGRQAVLGRLTALIRGNLQEMPHAGLGVASCGILHTRCSSPRVLQPCTTSHFSSPSSVCLALRLQS